MDKIKHICFLEAGSNAKHNMQIFQNIMEIKLKHYDMRGYKRSSPK